MSDNNLFNFDNSREMRVTFNGSEILPVDSILTIEPYEENWKKTVMPKQVEISFEITKKDLKTLKKWMRRNQLANFLKRLINKYILGEKTR